MNSLEANPYAPPVSEALPTLVPNAKKGYFYRDGGYLVVSHNAELPSRCVLTNKPVPEGGWRKSVPLAWTPPWVFVTFLAGFLVALILIIVLQKKAKITCSLSPEGRGRIGKKKLAGWLLLVSSIGLFFAAFNATFGPDLTGVAFVAGILTLIVSLVFFVIANHVKAVKYRDGWFRVKGCSPEFLASLPVMPSSPF